MINISANKVIRKVTPLQVHSDKKASHLITGT